MGYQIYWSNCRWQGYGVPAYCDHKNCNNKIDRGMGYQHQDDNDGATPNVIVCDDHRNASIRQTSIDYKREHPEWLSHILNDESWEQWRDENKEVVKEYRDILAKLDAESCSCL